MALAVATVLLEVLVFDLYVRAKPPLTDLVLRGSSLMVGMVRLTVPATTKWYEGGKSDHF